MCCIIDSSPIVDSSGRFKVHSSLSNEFQTPMLQAPFYSCKACFYCLLQMSPFTMGIVQYQLRREALNYDMTKYTCCQGYYANRGCCCMPSFSPKSCNEDKCPDFCLFTESCCCNSCAVSSTRLHVQEKYQLNSDACDYRLIRFNNFVQMASCIFDIFAALSNNQELRKLSSILNHVADVVYHMVSGMMTAQVVAELEYQSKNPDNDEQTERHHAVNADVDNKRNKKYDNIDVAITDDFDYDPNNNHSAATWKNSKTKKSKTKYPVVEAVPIDDDVM